MKTYCVHSTEDKGLNLNVSLYNDPASPSTMPAPFPPNNFVPSIDIDNFNSNNEKYYLVGNITFSCMTNRIDDMTYFKYKFGDGMTEPYSLSSDITHTYGSAGVYNYTVDAVAINKHSKAFHDAHCGQIKVLGKECTVAMSCIHGMGLGTGDSPSLVNLTLP